jgi:hypothetical protein
MKPHVTTASLNPFRKRSPAVCFQLMFIALFAFWLEGLFPSPLT